MTAGSTESTPAGQFTSARDAKRHDFPSDWEFADRADSHRNGRPGSPLDRKRHHICRQCVSLPPRPLVLLLTQWRLTASTAIVWGVLRSLDACATRGRRGSLGL